MWPMADVVKRFELWDEVAKMICFHSIGSPPTPKYPINPNFPARALLLKSTRAVLGRRCPHSGEGEDFFDVSAQKIENWSQVGKWTVSLRAKGFNDIIWRILSFNHLEMGTLFIFIWSSFFNLVGHLMTPFCQYVNDMIFFKPGQIYGEIQQGG